MNIVMIMITMINNIFIQMILNLENLEITQKSLFMALLNGFLWISNYFQNTCIKSISTDNAIHIAVFALIASPITIDDNNANTMVPTLNDIILPGQVWPSNAIALYLMKYMNTRLAGIPNRDISNGFDLAQGQKNWLWPWK